MSNFAPKMFQIANPWNLVAPDKVQLSSIACTAVRKRLDNNVRIVHPGRRKSEVDRLLEREVLVLVSGVSLEVRPVLLVQMLPFDHKASWHSFFVQRKERPDLQASGPNVRSQMLRIRSIIYRDNQNTCPQTAVSVSLVSCHHSFTSVSSCGGCEKRDEHVSGMLDTATRPIAFSGWCPQSTFHIVASPRLHRLQNSITLP